MFFEVDERAQINIKITTVASRHCFGLGTHIAVSILTSEQQSAARELNGFAILCELMLQVSQLERRLSTFDFDAPEVHVVSLRDMVHAIVTSAERIELALWSDDTRAWALADSIRIRASKLWDEWNPPDAGTCLWLALERSVPIGRQLRAIARLGELLQTEISATFSNADRKAKR